MKKINLNFKLSYLSILSCIAILSSCSKKDNSLNDLGNNLTKPDGIMAYYDFSMQKSNAVFALKQFTTLAVQNENRVTQVGGFFIENNKSVAKGDVKIGDMLLKANVSNNNMYGFLENKGDHLYGKTIQFNMNINNTILNGGNSSNGSNVNDTLYIPQKVVLSSPISNNSQSLQSGSLISWNVDSRNQKGVVIALEYDPSYTSNAGLKASNPKKIIKGFTLNDAQGSYTISNQDIINFPKDAYLKLTVGRANFKSTDAGTAGVYSIYAYTMVESYFKLSK
jgi:hypothetical protein